MKMTVTWWSESQPHRPYFISLKITSFRCTQHVSKCIFVHTSYGTHPEIQVFITMFLGQNVALEKGRQVCIL
jgi:hypothetical protein